MSATTNATLSSVTFKIFFGDDIRRFTLPASALHAYAEIVRKVCDAYCLEAPRFLSENALEFFADGWEAPRLVRSDADLRMIPELEPTTVRPGQLFRVRILSNSEAEKQQPQVAASAAAPEPAPLAAPPTTAAAEKSGPKVMRINKEALAAIRESFRTGRAEAKEDVKEKRREVRELRLKLKQACKQARMARVEGDFERAKEEKTHAKDLVKEARQRLAEAEDRLADCKGRVRRVKEDMRVEILAARTEMAAMGATSSSSEDALTYPNGSGSGSSSNESESEFVETPSSALAALQTGACVVLQSLATKSTLKVSAKDQSVSASGHRGRPARFIVTRCDDLVQFQSLLTGSYLRIDKEKAANARGNGGFCTWFRPVLGEDGSFALQSVFFEKTAGAKVFLTVSGSSKETWSVASTEDDAASPSSRFVAISMKCGSRKFLGEEKSKAASGESKEEASSTTDQGRGVRRYGMGFALSSTHGFGGHGFGPFHHKRARIAELERENLALKEENARLKEENARLKEQPREQAATQASEPQTVIPGSVASAPAKNEAVAEEPADKKTKKALSRLQKEAASAAKETPASLKVGDTVFLQSQTTLKHLRIHRNGKVDGLGNWGACARLRVVGSEGDAIQLTNSKDNGLLLCVGASGKLETGSAVGPSSWFRVVRHEDGFCSLQSALFPDYVVAVLASGEAKVLGDAHMNMDAPHGKYRLRLA